MSETAGDELAQLVRSLDDLEAERAVGDLDDADYRTLRDDYTVRVADAMRRAAGRSQPATGAVPSPSPTEPAVGSSPRSARRYMVLAGLTLFALGAGWLLARSAGERGLGEALTGGIDQSSRQRVVAFQQLGMADGDLLGAIRCLDEVLVSNPENAEALTYRAWFLVLASSGDDEAGESQREELLTAAAVYLDRAIGIEPRYPDARAFRAVVADRVGDRTETCAQIAALVELDPPPFFIDQTRDLVERNAC